LLAACGGAAAPSPGATAERVTWRTTAAPAGLEVPGARWLQVSGAGGTPTSEQVAAVIAPDGRGPFPVVVYLHGSGGLALTDLTWSRHLVDAGFLVVAGCWSNSTSEKGLYCGPGALGQPRDAAAALV